MGWTATPAPIARPPGRWIATPEPVVVPRPAGRWISVRQLTGLGAGVGTPAARLVARAAATAPGTGVPAARPIAILDGYAYAIGDPRAVPIIVGLIARADGEGSAADAVRHLLAAADGVGAANAALATRIVAAVTGSGVAAAAVRVAAVMGTATGTGTAVGVARPVSGALGDGSGSMSGIAVARIVAAATGVGAATAVAWVRAALAATAVGVGTPNADAAKVIPPVLFDASHNGALVDNAATITWTHPAGTAGRDVFVMVSIRQARTIAAITCGGVAMSQVAVGNHNNNAASGTTRLFRLSGVAAAARAIVLTVSGGTTSLAGCSSSYLNVATVGAIQQKQGATYGAAGFTQDAVRGAAGEWILQGFGASQGVTFTNLTSPTGGTNRGLATAQNIRASVTLSDAAADTTFGASSTALANYAAIAAVLAPIT